MRKSRLFLPWHSSPFAPGTVLAGTVYSNTCASTGSATDSAGVMDPTGSCSVLDSAQALLPALMNTYSVHYLEQKMHLQSSGRGKEFEFVAAFQKPQNSEMVFRISLSSFETVSVASNTESPASEHVLVFEQATGFMSNRSSAFTVESHSPECSAIPDLAYPYSQC